MRVVAGSLRGRRLRVGAGRETRPTSERARSGLFDWLGSEVLEASVLDLFSGAGTLGVEALSRGASRAVFVEHSRSALQALRGNLADLELGGRSEVIPRDVGRFLAGAARAGEAFDLILADPPYGSDWPPRLAGSARIRELLAMGGSLVIERSTRDPRPEPGPGLVLRDSRAWGETAFDWFEREEAAR